MILMLAGLCRNMHQSMHVRERAPCAGPHCYGWAQTAQRGRAGVTTTKACRRGHTCRAAC